MGLRSDNGALTWGWSNGQPAVWDISHIYIYQYRMYIYVCTYKNNNMNIYVNDNIYEDD